HPQRQTLPPLSSQVAPILRRKNKLTYTPHLHTADYLIIINPSKIQFTPNKQHHKIYHPHSNHPRPLKSISPPQLKTTNPQPLLQTSIKPILPTTPLPQKQRKKLFL
ncbi:uL13 family ribosomal protein, partial [Staphylococcus epidermidis]|uniref:uL13 family ribosomal protein n=1 Tax=Staphylococcus epidermidis TaxID=1282 RepID=UPI0011A1B865